MPTAKRSAQDKAKERHEEEQQQEEEEEEEAGEVVERSIREIRAIIIKEQIKKIE